MTVRGGGRPRRYVGRPADGSDPENRPPYATGDEVDSDEDAGARGGRYTGRYAGHYAGDGDDSYEPGGDARPYPDVSGVRYGVGYDLRKRYSSRRSGHHLGFIVFALVLASIVVGGLVFVVRPIAARGIADWAAENQTALQLPFMTDLVRSELGSSLTEPAGTDATGVQFRILHEETPKEIAAALLQEHLLKDDRAVKAFVFESIVKDAIFIEGSHTLRQTMTIDQIIAELQKSIPVAPTVKVTFREGLRIEQMVALLEDREANPKPEDADHPLKLDVKKFYDLATRPPATLTQKYTWLKQGVSLEGFLFPATYQIPPDATPDVLITMMLEAFQRNAPADLLKLTPDKVYQTMTLASLVETEAKVDEERATIAGVYANRLAGGAKFPTKLLNADPTINYANDTMQLRKMPIAQWVQYTFWERVPDPLAGFQVSKDLAGYQTYVHPGLPPTPICSPSQASIDAALAPNTAAGYYYFVAIPDGSGKHAFAKTEAEQNANLKKYGYQ